MVEACDASNSGFAFSNSQTTEQQAQPGHTIMFSIDRALNLCEDVCYILSIDCKEAFDQKARSR